MNIETWLVMQARRGALVQLTIEPPFDGPNIYALGHVQAVSPDGNIRLLLTTGAEYYVYSEYIAAARTEDGREYGVGPEFHQKVV